MDLTSARLTTNGVELHVVQSGPVDGPLVILLHGFPEFWYGWRKQIPALANAGFRVWAPDQRGYNTSDKPPRIRDYRLDKLADDIAGLIKISGRRRVTVVGHDWGGAVAWWLASNYPELVARLVILNVPHPLVMQRMLWTDPRQTLRSWYMFFFQLPWLPEALLLRNNWAPAADGLQTTSRSGVFTETELELYRGAWSQPGSMRAMVNWYRAAFWHPPPPPRNERIMPPTLILWGTQDKFIRQEAALPSVDRCDLGELVYYNNATHWLQHEEYQDVNERIIEFASRS